MRVVSLVPSSTETLLAGGVDVVACTRFCEQPAMRHVGGTKDPDVAAIVALAPDLVVMDREENRREDAEALAAARVRVHVTHVTSLADVTPTLVALARATGVASAADMVRAASAYDVAADAVPVAGGDGCRVAVLIWRRPWMALGAATYGSSVLRHLGLHNVLLPADGAYPEAELAVLAERRPDLVVLPSEPYPFAERHVREVTEGVPGAAVVLVDGRDLFWWGVRTPAALDRLSGALQRSR